MQYLALVVSILMGYWLDDIWKGILVGSILWLVFGQAKKEMAQHSIKQLEQKIAEIQAELNDLQQRCQHWEQTGTAPPRSRQASQAETPNTVLPDATGFQTGFANAQTDVATGEPLHTSPPAYATHIDNNLNTVAIHPLPTAQTKLPEHPFQTGISAPESPRTIEDEIPLSPENAGGKHFVIKRSSPKTAQAAAQPKPKRENPIFAWLMRGNPLLKAGVVILFLGLAFLLRLASEYIEVSIQARYIGVGLAGLAATVAGWRLQQHKRDYGLVLQGFGIAVMYLTSLAALKLHPLLPPGAAFTLMVALVGLMALLAVRQNALILAQIALIGGMAAPILTSDGSNNYIVLFGYLALLNTGVAAIAWFKAWRSLNLTGFIGTFIIGAAWGAQAYTPQNFATTEPFLLYHWLLYTLIACLFARKVLAEKPLHGHLQRIPDNASLSRIGQSIFAYGRHIDLLDSALLFGTAFASFGLQYQMVSTWEYGAAWSAAGFAAVYAVLAWRFAAAGSEMAVMKQAFTLLALLFITLAVPLALDQQWTAAAWTLEAALVYVFGLRQQQPIARLLALAVYLMAAVTQLSTYSYPDTLDTVLDGSLIGTLFTAAGGGWMYLARQRQPQRPALWEQKTLSAVLALAVLHVSLLPLLLWNSKNCIAPFALLAALWAYCQRKQPQAVFSVAATLSALSAVWLSLSLSPIGIENGSIVHTIGGGILLTAAAYWLQRNLWLSETTASEADSAAVALRFNTQLNQSCGWLVITTALYLAHHGIQLLLDKLSSADLMLSLWSLPLLFAAFAPMAKRLNWPQAKLASLAFGVLFCLYALSQNLYEHPLAGALVMVAATALHAYIVNMQRLKNQSTVWVHGIGLLLFGMLWTNFTGKLGDRYLEGVWTQLAWIAVPFALWLLLYARRHQGLFQRYPEVYWQFGSVVCAVYAAGWLLWVNFAQPYAPAPLPYLPVVNPLEITLIALLWHSLRWLPVWLPANWSDTARKQAFALPLLLAFITLSAGVMRAWHFFDGVTWSLPVLTASFGLQASLSIIWALTAITLMVSGNQSGQRQRWFIGASLMGLVVVKLFVIELGNSGSISRIVSFIVVGLLLLLVGWYAPVPPKEEKAADKPEN